MKPACGFLALFVLLSACGTSTGLEPAATATPSVPPLVEGFDRFARIRGSVVDQHGGPVPGAVVRGWSADRSCTPRTLARNVAVTRKDGTFSLQIEFGRGPEERGCAVLEATAGGAISRVTVPVTYSASEMPDGSNQANVNLPLGAARKLDRTEAERIVNLLVEVIRNPEAEQVRELVQYTDADQEQFRAAITDYQFLLRNVSSVELSESHPERFTFVLHGPNEKTIRTVVQRDTLIRIRSPLFENSLRARTLLTEAVRLSVANDLLRLAAVLDINMKRATELAQALRKYDPEFLVIRLDAIDEEGGALSYRLSGGGREEETLEVGYGNDRVWLRS